MRFLVVDDEWLALRSMKNTLHKIYPSADIICEEDYRGALLHVNKTFDAIFLDIEMPVMNGIQLAKEFQKVNPRVNIIFVTAYSDYTGEAFHLHASGYLTKPASVEQIKKEMQFLRFDVQQEEEKKLVVQCFGNFEIFYGKEPLRFERRIAKEILAYLIHLRGAMASSQEICAILWEDSAEIDRRKGYFRSVMASLRNTLKEYDSEDLLISNRNSYGINTELLDCDFYRYLEGDTSPSAMFRGEYMSQYSWAESMVAQLSGVAE